MPSDANRTASSRCSALRSASGSGDTRGAADAAVAASKAAQANAAKRARIQRTATLSAAHFQHRAAEEAVNAVEIDDDRDALAVLVLVALEWVCAVVHLGADGFVAVDVCAAAQRHERASGGLEVAVHQRHGRILRDRLEQSAFRIAHPDRELLVAIRLRAAAVRDLRRV